MAMMESQETATKPRTVKVLMFTVTESLANTLFNASNVVLIVGAAAVLIGTIGSIAMGAAKEHFSNERISTNEAESARAKEAAAVANEKAESERVERLKLEIRLAPRMLARPTAAAFSQTLAATVRGMTIDIISYEGMGADVAPLSQQIAAALTAAGATVHVLTPMGTGGVVRGILVRTAADASASEKGAISRVVGALLQAGLTAGSWAEYPADEPPAGAYTGPGTPLAKFRILIGAKP